MALTYSNAGPILQAVSSLGDTLFPDPSKVTRNRYYAAKAQETEDSIQAKRRLSDMIRTVQGTEGYKAAAATGADAARAYIARQLHAEVPFLSSGQMGNAGKWAAQYILQAFPKGDGDTQAARDTFATTGGMNFRNTNTGQARDLASREKRQRIATAPAWARVGQAGKEVARYEIRDGKRIAILKNGQVVTTPALPNNYTATETTPGKDGKPTYTYRQDAAENRATATGKPGQASTTEKTVKYISQTMGISEADALKIYQQRKSMSYRDRIAAAARALRANIVNSAKTDAEIAAQAKKFVDEVDRISGVAPAAPAETGKPAPTGAQGKQPDRTPPEKMLAWPGREKAKRGLTYRTPKGRRVRITMDGQLQVQLPNGKWVSPQAGGQ